MLHDLKWGIGGGIGMILLAHLSVTTGLISPSRGAPLLAGGALLMLTTTIVLLFRSGTGVASAATISHQSLLLPTERSLDEVVSETHQPADLPARCEEPEPMHHDVAAPPQDAPGALPPAPDQAIEGVHQRLRQAIFSFRSASYSAEFLLRVPRNATTSEIAQKAVEVAQQMMRRQGISEDDLRSLKSISGRWVSPEA